MVVEIFRKFLKVLRGLKQILQDSCNIEIIYVPF